MDGGLPGVYSDFAATRPDSSVCKAIIRPAFAPGGRPTRALEREVADGVDAGSGGEGVAMFIDEGAA